MVWVVALTTLASPAARSLDEATPVRVIGEVRLHEPTAPRAEMLEWALGRYEAAHLAVPAVDVHFHPAPSGCRDRLGLMVEGRIDLCVRMELEPGPLRIVLHELAHVWTSVHVTEVTRTSFVRQRGLTAWNNPQAPWKDRGNEQAAEIIAWGLGDGTMGPLISGDREPVALAAAFRLLTGTEPLQGAA